MTAEATAGTLYIVATPLGNLEDVTTRARRVLGEVAVVACEDTRHSRPLLQHLGVRTPLVSYHDHNAESRAAELLGKLEAGDDVALISDAGTPCISDPGYRLVAACAEAGVRVVPVPGPSAVIAALSAAGMATDRFHFLGFLPREGKRRRRALEAVAELTGTLVVYESPHRILAALEDVGAVLGAEREVCVARELTKRFEEFVRGTPEVVRERLEAENSVRGEMTVLIAGASDAAEDGEDSAADPQIAKLVEALREQEMSARSIRDVLVSVYGLTKREAYAIAMA